MGDLLFLVVIPSPLCILLHFLPLEFRVVLIHHLFPFLQVKLPFLIHLLISPSLLTHFINVVLFIKFRWIHCISLRNLTLSNWSRMSQGNARSSLENQGSTRRYLFKRHVLSSYFFSLKLLWKLILKLLTFSTSRSVLSVSHHN
jgi:hypothetical protein